MQCKKLVFVNLCTILISTCIAAQSLDKTDNQFFLRTLDTFLSKRDYEIEVRKTELTIIIMEVDSSGKVSGVHLFSDEKRRDRTYTILSQLKPEIFHRRRFEKCSGRLIFLPVVTGSAKAAAMGYPDTISRNVHSTYEDKSVIWAKTIHYQMPGYSDESHIIKAEGHLIDTANYKKKITF